MKKILVTLTLVAVMSSGFAQVEVGKVKGAIVGKGKLIAIETDKMTLDNFSVMVNRYKFAEDQGANGAQVGIRASLGNVDEALVQEITDDVYAYFVLKWKERGVEVVVPTKAEIESSAKYSKAVKKGKEANIISGGAWVNEGKKINQITVWPNGVNIGSSGSGPVAAFGNAANLGLDGSGSGYFTSYTASVDFIEFKTAAIGSTAQVKTFPKLSSYNTLGATKWQKNKVAMFGANNQANGLEEYYSERKDSDIGNLGMWEYVADQAKFKANVTELIKKSMDEQFANYDAEVEKNTK
ncbi:MAG: hypothetical protein JXQ90_16230 [Cyclobacteriaceae bacterium]